MSNWQCRRCGQAVSTTAQYAAALCGDCVFMMHHIYGEILSRPEKLSPKLWTPNTMKKERPCGKDCEL